MFIKMLLIGWEGSLDRIGLHALDRVSLGSFVPIHAPATSSSKVRGEFMFLPQGFLRLQQCRMDSREDRDWYRLSLLCRRAPG